MADELRKGAGRDESAIAVHAANRAADRKSLESRVRDTYSAAIDNAGPHERTDTMNATYTTSVATKLAAFAVAVVTSAVVLGSTVAGMQPRDEAGMNVIALERVTITATRTN
jgi:hypothetical protein